MLKESALDPEVVASPVVAAETAGLAYVSDSEPGIRRRKSGKGFRYLSPAGRTLSEPATLARIRKLAIPPAYTDVWICPRADGHIQATGRDARNRKQYLYHPAWRAVRDATKFEHMLEFAAALPRIRKRIAADMRRPGVPRERALAAVVALLEKTLIRIGDQDYAKNNQSFGLTTLRDRHVDVVGGDVRFLFKGKSGKEWKLRVKDRRIAKVVRTCQDLPGQHLFQYIDENGERHPVSSSDINGYLREITGRDITAKDFRTWAGTVLAAMALSEFTQVDEQAVAKKNVKAVIERVAARLGNTPTICRSCYVHPEVLQGYLDGELVQHFRTEVEHELRDTLADLKPEEAAVLSFLHNRLVRETKPRLVRKTKARRRREPGQRRAA